ncbi:MAG: ABC transporter permease [Egibacteraceae bacterium]
MSWRRIRAVVLQHAFIMRRSPFRMMELFYWPLIEVVLWGFIATFLATTRARIPGGVGVLLGAVVLWDVLFRSQQELVMTYMIDMWDRNVLNLYASPLRQVEYVLGGVLFSTARVLVGTSILVLVTRVAFGFNMLRAGAILLPAFLVLVGMGWALGLVIRAAILRFGSNAEVLAWSLAALLQPVAAVFYPVDVLPGWLQSVALMVPAAHVFEALRALFATGEAQLGRLLFAGLLDLVYLAVGALALSAAMRAVRQRGLLSRPGY